MMKHLVLFFNSYFSTTFVEDSEKKKGHSYECPMDPGSCLSSRAVSSQVLSVYVSLTSVFGMGTGGTSQLNHRKGGLLSSNLKTA